MFDICEGTETCTYTQLASIRKMKSDIILNGGKKEKGKKRARVRTSLSSRKHYNSQVETNEIL